MEGYKHEFWMPKVFFKRCNIATEDIPPKVVSYFQTKVNRAIKSEIYPECRISRHDRKTKILTWTTLCINLNIPIPEEIRDGLPRKVKIHYTELPVVIYDYLKEIYRESEQSADEIEAIADMDFDRARHINDILGSEIALCLMEIQDDLGCSFKD